MRWTTRTKLSMVLNVVLWAAACGDNPSTGDGDGGTPVGGDADADAGGIDLAGDAPNGDVPIEECDAAVCYEARPLTAYPEAMDPAQHALHCNERGVVAGCPAGTVCGDVGQLSDGRRVPLCEPAFERLDGLDFDVPASGPNPEDGVAVTLELRLDGERLPARLETSFYWGTRLVLTHRETGWQAVAPLPRAPDEGGLVELSLPRGRYDTLLLLVPSELPALGLPALDLRGVLEVRDPGEAVLDLDLAPLTVSLRYLGSTLTSAESQIMSVRLTDSIERAITYNFAPNDRGTVTLWVPHGQYALRVQANGLPGLFPNVPLLLGLPVDVPAVASVGVELAAAHVRGNVTINGEPAGSEGVPAGRLLFQNEDLAQIVPIATDATGDFDALLWEHESYDVWWLGPDNLAGRVVNGWAPDGEALEVAVRRVASRLELDASALDLSSGTPLTLRLQVTAAGPPLAGGPWLSVTERDGDDLIFELDLVEGQPLDLVLSANEAGFPEGQWQLARGARAAEVMRFELAVADVLPQLAVLDDEGRPLRFTSADVWLSQNDDQFLVQRLRVVEGSVAERLVYPGQYRVSVTPAWQSQQPWAGYRYDLEGEVALEGTTSLPLELPIRTVTGLLRVDGEPVPVDPELGVRSGRLIASSLGVWQGVDLAQTGIPSYRFVLGPSVYTVSVLCWQQNCEVMGLSAGTTVLVDGLAL